MHLWGAKKVSNSSTFEFSIVGNSGLCSSVWY